MMHGPIYICAKVCKQDSRYSCQIWIKLEFFPRQIFKKVFKFQIALKSVQLERICTVRTDRQADMTKLTVVFHSFASALKKTINPFFLTRIILGRT